MLLRTGKSDQPNGLMRTIPEGSAYYAAYKHSWNSDYDHDPSILTHHQNGSLGVNNTTYSQKENLCCLPTDPRRFTNGTQCTTTSINNGQAQANNIIPNYGVYHETGIPDQEDEDGFVVPRSADRRLEVMVNIRGTSSVVQTDLEQTQRTGSSWCGAAPSSDAETSWSTWCRPEALFVILCIVVVLVSGALVYIWYVEYDYGHAYDEEPCEKTFCAWGAQCVAGADGAALCQCPTHCRPRVQPVCASDGHTYENQCLLRVASCRARLNIKVSHEGKCGRNDPCKEKQCGWGARCVASLDGRASCQCPDECPSYGDHSESRPVCGNNNQDYKDNCELMRAACTAAENITVKHPGKCDPCLEYNCTHGATCVNLSGEPYCECPSCPEDYDPVCGSDGSTYNNQCNLLHHACTIQQDISVIAKGPCNGCESKQCDFYATCVEDKETGGKCVCPQSCEDPQLWNGSICGMDGQTYSDECDLRMQSCAKQKVIMINYKGHCDLCLGIECKYGGKCNAGECICPKDCLLAGNEPVCGSNLVTYPNECELLKIACSNNLTSNQNGNLSVLFYGDCSEKLSVPVTAPSNLVSPTSLLLPSSESTTPVWEACKDIQCDFEATCELGPDNFPRCICQFNCTSDESSDSEPICASNMRIYPSLCTMKMEACHNQQELRLRPLDLCQGMEVKPCNGDQPLLDVTTGKDFDCGNGPERQDCPSGSYCHQTTRFAKCCLKDHSTSQPKEPKGCESSLFGCCHDGRTPAQGPSYLGCAPFCGCNKLGSYSENCNLVTLQCKCRPGVGGEKCDRCEPGYWGLPKISSGHHGCIPCGCSTFGSVRDDCEQMTGRCVCKPGVQGQKCNICANTDKVLGPNGCLPVFNAPPAKTCKDLECYLGGICEEKDGKPFCNCQIDLTCEEGGTVCGSDGQSYHSACALRHVACKLQKDIVIQSFGPCRNEDNPGTEWPIRQYTPVQFTQSDDVNSALSKSTRHLMVPDPRFYYDSRDYANSLNPYNIKSGYIGFVNGEGINSVGPFQPTPATVRVVQALLGDLCSVDTECLITFSECMFGACHCQAGYADSPSRQDCLPVINNSEVTPTCDSTICLHGGTCLESTRDCQCSPGYTGLQCETVIIEEYDIPGFDGKGYIRLKPLKAYHKLSIEIEFKTYSNNGVILYNQQKENGLGDFVSLAIVRGYVEFRYDLGNGPVVISSLDKVQLNTFHRVMLKRYHRDGMLQLDDGEVVTGQSSGTLRALDLFEDLYIGFVPTNKSRIYTNIGVGTGFQGCIKKLKIGRKLVDLHQKRDELIIYTQGIRDCSLEVPCNLPCQNNGLCKFQNGTTNSICHCLPSFKGIFCEFQSIYTSFSLPEFNGSSYITLPTLKISKTFTIEITFLTKVRNGLLLYNGQIKTGFGDFISVSLIKGHVQFRFNLGSGICNITSKETIELGTWHIVKVHRDGREGTLQLDNGVLSMGYSGATLTELNLELPLYLGSVRSWQEVHRLAGVSVGIRGALQKVVVDGTPINISGLPICNGVDDEIGCGYAIQEYKGLPCTLSNESSPCYNQGVCIPLINDYMCQCLDHYQGQNCEIAKNDLAVKFDGETNFLVQNGSNVDNDVIFHEKEDYRIESFEMEIKTSAENGLILWQTIDEGFLSIAIVNGYPEFKQVMGNDGFSWVVNSKIKVDDGSWHKIQVKRHKNRGYLLVDSDDGTLTLGLDQNNGYNLHPPANSNIWIGGVPSIPQELPKTYYLGFYGCVKTLILNNQPINLYTLSPKTDFCHNDDNK